MKLPPLPRGMGTTSNLNSRFSVRWKYVVEWWPNAIATTPPRQASPVNWNLYAEGVTRCLNSRSWNNWSASIEPELSMLDLVSSLLYQRSEEHTSELQSRGHLVCRLLLEKKKK